MNITAGYIYVLINPTMSGVVKIGKTQSNPDDRAKELSSATGVPTPFFVAYSAYFTNCHEAEKFVHERLGTNRLANNREFFRITLQQAIVAVREAEDSLETTSPELIQTTVDGIDTPFTSELFTTTSKKRREEILSAMTCDEQADIFNGAPVEIILECIPLLCTEAQVKVWRKYLPVGARDKAKKVLSYDAKVKVGLADKKRKVRWTCMA